MCSPMISGIRYMYWYLFQNFTKKGYLIKRRVLELYLSVVSGIYRYDRSSIDRVAF